MVFILYNTTLKKKLLESDWLTAVAFQLNFKLSSVNISKLPCIGRKDILAPFMDVTWHKYHPRQIKIVSNFLRLLTIEIEWNSSELSLAVSMPKFPYKSCCYLYWYRHCSYPVCSQKAPLSLRCSCTNFSHWFARNEPRMAWRIDDTQHSIFQCWLGITAIKQEFSALSVDVSSERQEKDFCGIQIKINGDERERIVFKKLKKKRTHTPFKSSRKHLFVFFLCINVV